MASIGILGGSFNPPHLGHLQLARHARDELALDRVVLMPVHTQPHKGGAADPGPEQRLQMCRLLIAGEPGVETSDLEVRRGGTSYTADTLSAIHDREPDAQLTFIVGADTARTLPTWHEPARVVALARLAVATRSGTGEDDVREAIEPLGARVDFLRMGPVEISSSLVRERAAAGEPLAPLLGGAVAEYVSDHHLYQEAAHA